MRIGIDFGGTSIKIGLVDASFAITARHRVETHPERGAQGMMEDTAQGVRTLLAQSGTAIGAIEAVGMGIPGGVDNVTGVVCQAANIGLENAPVRDILSSLLDVDVSVANDADAAAYGELTAGAAKGASSTVLVTLGTGVGSGIIIDSKIYNGAYHCGGELGHMVIERGGRACTCGRRGCFEAYCSASALIAMTKEAAAAHPESLLNLYHSISGQSAFEAARKGDAGAKGVVDTFIEYLGIGLINIANALQPEVLMIGGGVSHEGDYILEPIRERMYREVYSRFSDKQTRLCRATLGNDAGIIGAAYMK